MTVDNDGRLVRREKIKKRLATQKKAQAMPRTRCWMGLFYLRLSNLLGLFDEA